MDNVNVKRGRTIQEPIYFPYLWSIQNVKMTHNVKIFYIKIQNFQSTLN